MSEFSVIRFHTAMILTQVMNSNLSIFRKKYASSHYVLKELNY